MQGRLGYKKKVWFIPELVLPNVQLQVSGTDLLGRQIVFAFCFTAQPRGEPMGSSFCTAHS